MQEKNYAALPIALRWATWLAIGGIVLASLWELLYPEGMDWELAAMVLTAKLETDLPPDMPFALRGLSVSLATAPLVYALLRLAALLGLATRGEVFSAPASAHLRSFGLWLLIATLAQSLVPMLLQLTQYWLAAANSTGTIKLEFSSADAWNVFMSALFMLVARVLSDGYRLAEENRQFI
jgi:hypothetical protein